MKQNTKKLACLGVGVLAAFVLWTLLVCIVDVEAIGAQASRVGFAQFNATVHKLTGVNMTLYTITDWLGLIPIAVAFGFAVFGLVQWISRKSFLAVDRDILALGGFYLVVMAVYALFEVLVINHRPILINGIPEASYPSSTTMLVVCVIPAAIIQFKKRIQNTPLRRVLCVAMAAFTAFMVVGRLFSGVHWITDIIGGLFFGAGIVIIYQAIVTRCNIKNKTK